MNKPLIKQSCEIPLHSLICVYSPSLQRSIDIASELFPEYEILDREKVSHSLFGKPHDDDFRKEIFVEIRHLIKQKLSLGERVVFCSQYIGESYRIDILTEAKYSAVPCFYFIELNEKSNDRALINGDRIAQPIILNDSPDIHVVSKTPDDSDQLYNYLVQNYRGIDVMPDVHGSYKSFIRAYDGARQRGHFFIMLGDIIDYGPDPIQCIDLAYSIVTRGHGILIRGNHEVKIAKWLTNPENPNLYLGAGNRVTTDAISALDRNNRHKLDARFKTLMNLSRDFLRIKNIMFCHAAVHPDFWKIQGTRLLESLHKNLALYGEIDEANPKRSDGYPNRVYNWVNELEENQLAIVGHDIRSKRTPFVANSSKGGKAVFLDLGCGKGGLLCTASIKLNTSSEILSIPHYSTYLND